MAAACLVSDTHSRDVAGSMLEYVVSVTPSVYVLRPNGLVMCSVGFVMCRTCMALYNCFKTKIARLVVLVILSKIN